MHDFRFGQPEWGHLIWILVPLAGLLIWFEIIGRRNLDQFLTAMMQRRLVARVTAVRRFVSLACLMLGMLALVVAAMRPQWGATRRSLERAGAQIMVCLDVSKSMLAEDTVPNRLGRAKADLVDLLDLMQGEQVGLIAFAGQATLVSPMTTDLGFLKLLLENLDIYSVGRGGTRLEEPIRLAVEGFGEAADISRVILLITDGEDHDSFPLDAAEDARTRGIRIITIGFGDESGSRIEMTNPRTGARQLLTDADGNPVLSRLDGATLRDIALRTDGAYIPAGTGALDLREIYRQHIQPLMRGTLSSHEQIIRNEIFQWPLLAAVLLLAIWAVLTRSASAPQWETSASPVVSGNRTFGATATLIVLIATLYIPVCSLAQTGQDPRRAAPTVDSNAGGNGTPAAPDGNGSATESSARQFEKRSEEPIGKTTEEPIEEPLGAREAYNRAVTLVGRDLEAAESLLMQARRESGTDGEVRFRAAYNLGWVEVKKADALLADNPQQALIHLRSAADWFRQAVRIRPQDNDPRHNLEIVMRRALELADALAARGRGDVSDRLDALIKQQREFLVSAGQFIQNTSRRDETAVEAIADREFRRLANDQLQILSEAEALLRQVHEELAAAEQEGGSLTNAPSPANDAGGEDPRVRTARLSAVKDFLQQAVQRMGQARSQFRRKQSDRGYRRASVALDELKRARDMLREVPEILRGLLHDLQSIKRQTELMDQSRSVNEEIQTSKPEWLTKELLVQSQSSLADWTRIWAEQLTAWADEPEAAGPQPPDDDAAEQSQASLRQAAPFVVAAAERIDEATEDVDAERFAEAVGRQQEAADLLAAALELFLDLKGLIEITYAKQTEVSDWSLLVTDSNTDNRDRRQNKARSLQQENLRRLDRLEEFLTTQQRRLSESPASAEADEDPANQNGALSESEQQAERERLELASRLVKLAREQMQDTKRLLDDVEQLDEAATEPEVTDEEVTDEEVTDEEVTDEEVTDEEVADQAPTNRKANDQEAIDQKSTAGHHNAKEGAAALDAPSLSPDARQRSESAVETLQQLRRLFFSIEEHVREAVQRQSDINDQTQAQVGRTESSGSSEWAPLEQSQQQLAGVSREIAQALREQAEQAPSPSLPPEQTSRSQSGSEETRSEALKEAAEFIGQAVDEMDATIQSMQEATRDITEVRAHQDESLKNLLAALALLSPPNQGDNSQQDQQEQQPQSEGEEDQDQQQAAGASSDDPRQDMSATQLLQFIRDRDAARRRDQERRKAKVGSSGVEKDW